MKNPALARFRDEQKALAARIRASRQTFKASQRAGEPDWKAQADASAASCQYRYRHIAYSLVRGRTMGQIERPKHAPDMARIEEIRLELEAAASQDRESSAAAHEATLYVIVDTAVEPHLRPAQAGHAIAEFTRRHPQAWNNGRLVLLVSESLHVMHGMRTNSQVKVAKYQEVAFGMKTTAVAISVPPALTKEFSRHKLL
jgi:hypothetical protein